MAKAPVITEVKNLNGDVIQLSGAQLTRWNRFKETFKPSEKTDTYNTMRLERMTIEDWLMVPNFKHNRPWLARFCEAANSHLVGRLTSPEQVIVRALVDKDGKMLCKLDGHSRTGAWLAGALERPEYVQCICYTLPEGETIDGEWVAALFESINNKASAPTNAELEASATSRLFAAGEGLNIGETHFVKKLNLTAFKAAASNITVPRNQAAPVYWRAANASLMFVLDNLAFDENEMRAHPNCYTAVVSAYIMKTLTDKDPVIVQLAYDFWLNWGQTTAPQYITELFNKVSDSDQSGAGAKKTVLQWMENTMLTHKKHFIPVEDFNLPAPDQDAEELAEMMASTTGEKEKAKEAGEVDLPFFDGAALERDDKLKADKVVSMPPVADVDVLGQSDDYQDAPKAADGSAIQELGGEDETPLNKRLRLQGELEKVEAELKPLDDKKKAAKGEKLHGEEFHNWQKLTAQVKGLKADIEDLLNAEKEMF